MPKITHTINAKNPPKISKTDSAKLDAVKDGDIDFSDIPELGEDFFQKVRTKERITARFDRDVVEWFRSKGAGYQTSMNAVLRAFYDQHK